MNLEQEPFDAQNSLGSASCIDPDTAGDQIKQVDWNKLHLHFISLGLTESQANNVCRMCQEAPARPVGKGALKSVTTQFYSTKCNDVRGAESHSAELLRCDELELDPNILYFFCQVQCQRVARTKIRRGRSVLHISNAIVDLLVVAKDGVWLEEVKHSESIEKLLERKPDEWMRKGGVVRRPALENWASHQGLTYRIWSPPTPFGIYKANLEHLLASSTIPLSAAENLSAKRALEQINDKPATIESIANEQGAFNARIAAHLLSLRKCFGLLKSTSIADTHLFYLFADKDHAQEADRQQLDSSRAQLSPLTHDSILTNVSVKIYACAVERLHRIKDCESKRTKMPRRLRAVYLLVLAARENGTSELAACLPDYAASGNRGDRLLEKQRVGLESAIKTFWETGIAKDFSDLKHRLETICTLDSVALPGETAIRAAMAKSNSAKRALASGGKRAFQAQQKASDPASRTLPPLAVGYRLHIDSSKFDNRSAPMIADDLLLLCPVIYVAADAVSKGVKAHAFIFGSARTDGLAILIREYVFRHGELPREIILDRGPEMTGNWIKGFCIPHKIRLSWPPAAGHKFNSLAENIIGQLNSQLAHRLIGSTLPDQAGRSVDGAFKSYATARLQFAQISEETRILLYEDFESSGPALIEQESLAKFGKVGIPQAYDEMFLIDTSVPIPVCKIDQWKGARLSEGTFVSDDLLKLSQREKPSEMRLDCVDPTRLYIRFDKRWVVARSSGAQRSASHPTADKLFNNLYQPQLDDECKSLKARAKKIRLDRVLAANAASASNSHLAPDNLVTPPVKPLPPVEAEKSVLFDFESIVGFSQGGANVH